jgi:cell division protein ZapE
MTPLQHYHQDLAAGSLFPDPAQAHAIDCVQQLYDDLVTASLINRSSPVRRAMCLIRKKNKKSAPVRGIYFYGGVGRGKTYIMDILYESLPFKNKLRTHFHRFMQRVHAELNVLKQQKNPLKQVAAQLALEARVICFDEFYVSDIGDAMILGGLLEHLTEVGVVLVATSNLHPDSLYENGLQRARFLPAIALLHRHTRIVELDGGIDYRLRALEQATLYYSPPGAQADASLMRGFRSLTPEHAEVFESCGIEVLGRRIPAKFCADDVVWFEFSELCGGARSAYDYVELAKIYHAVLLSDVPQMGGANDDVVRRFVSLVDELYDHNVKLLISAAAPVQDLYKGGALSFVFERTRSRLLEMQSHEYLAREHKP